MRKIVVVLLAFILMVSCALAEGTDYSGMSNEELINTINQMRVELAKRNLNPEMIICDSDGLIVTINNDFVVEKIYDGSHKLVLNYVAANSGDKSISLNVEKLCINGWEVPCFELITLDAGKKAKGKIEVYSIDESAEITAADQIEDIELYGYTVDATTYNTLTQNIRMKVIFK